MSSNQVDGNPFFHGGAKLKKCRGCPTYFVSRNRTKYCPVCNEYRLTIKSNKRRS